MLARHVDAGGQHALCPERIATLQRARIRAAAHAPGLPGRCSGDSPGMVEIMDLILAGAGVQHIPDVSKLTSGTSLRRYIEYAETLQVAGWPPREDGRPLPCLEGRSGFLSCTGGIPHQPKV